MRCTFLNCPRCGARWSRKDPINGYVDCVTFCGMKLCNNTRSNTCIDLYGCHVYWYGEDDISTVWKNRERIYRGTMLPFDITEDMVMIMVTFQ